MQGGGLLTSPFSGRRSQRNRNRNTTPLQSDGFAGGRRRRGDRPDRKAIRDRQAIAAIKDLLGLQDHQAGKVHQGFLREIRKEEMTAMARGCGRETKDVPSTDERGQTKPRPSMFEGEEMMEMTEMTQRQERLPYHSLWCAARPSRFKSIKREISS